MKKRLTQKISVVLMSLFMIFATTMNTQVLVLADTNNSPVQITIFHTNDMHGRLLDAFNTANPPVLTQIGSDYTASIKKSVPNSILIDAGDATQGLPFATISKGGDVINLMNAAGYDGMVLGNHEFDYGKDQAMANAKLAKFPVVSANTLDNGQPFLKGVNGNNGTDFIKTVNGVKVGFFGITTQETVYKTAPSNLPNITFADPVETSKTEVSKLKSEGAQVIVAVMHVGNDASSSPTSADIAAQVSGINVLIDGHSHTVENNVVNNTLIAQTGCYNASVGRVDITVNSDNSITAKDSLISAADATKNYTPDPDVNALAKKVNASQTAMFSTIVGHTDTALWGGTVNGQSVARIFETNMGNLVADAMIDGAKAQVTGTDYAGLPIVALENGGGVRDTIPAGDINRGQVTTVLPFGNIISLKEVTPALLYQVLENGVSKIVGQDQSTGLITGADGRFPQISGMRFEYDPTADVSNRVTKIVLLDAAGNDNTVLDKNDDTTRIVLVSNDFEVGGGDGYLMLGKLKNIGEGNALDVITADYIKKITEKNGGSFSYPTWEGRIQLSSSYQYTAYTATITVKNGENLVANADVTYTLDNGDSMQATTDDNGILTIENVTSGPHNVTISSNGSKATVYINNVIGAGTSTGVTATLVASK